ncbi:MAG: aminotransferase class I/II-fold pyridoxal phosphate-dependent enzyme [Saprospiraceae bacterium]|nr:aminotransferase class I/II-fold pyridoxal phosphate-dependent enzyme [Saprospiraceae bacterium]MCC6843814.1 aminotransferase class I/II-fold pyridoxal phosphate-dependent enzyme [Saprospiraceae bacterium]
MNYRINLISDTVTKPTSSMLKAMLEAEVGDDVFREDPTVIKLEEKLSGMFGLESGLFCPSGTMANQIAIKAHTKPLDEMLCDIHSHVFQFEVGGYAFHSQIAVNILRGENGILNGNMIEENIKAKFDWLPRTKLVVIENTVNRAGGQAYSLEQLKDVSRTCRKNGLSLHLDGARIFNAMIASKTTPNQIGPLVDSISICLSKGLGAPIGSVLIGNKPFIEECRRIRKAMGGGMRQVGILAAAGIYALDHHLEKLVTDHVHAKKIEETLLKQSYISKVIPVQTNIIIFDLAEHISTDLFIKTMRDHEINCTGFGKRSIRLVTHLDISESMVQEVCETLNKITFKQF